MLSRAITAAFFDLSPDALRTLAGALTTRQLPAGRIVCHRGDEPQALYIIETGGVTVELTAEHDSTLPRIYLGPGQVFGEMSLLSGRPVSATVTTVRDTLFAVLRKEDFARLLELHPSMMTSFVRLLIERLQHRSNLSAQRSSPVILAIAPSDGVTVRFATLIVAAVARYAPGSIALVAVSHQGFMNTGAMGTRAVWPWLPELGPPPHDWGAGVRGGSAPVARIHCAPAWWTGAISRWRSGAQVGRYLVIVASPAEASHLLPEMTLGDAVLQPVETADSAGLIGDGGLADRGLYRIGDGRALRSDEHGWYHLLSPHRLTTAMAADDAAPSSEAAADASEFDRLARWLTCREVGIAMGAGAALGFAHLGVLQALQESAIPIDNVCGTSMGGAVALGFASSGRAETAIQLAKSIANSTRKLADLTWLPKSSLLRGHLVRKSIVESIGDRSFDQLELPAMVVAADLVRWQRHVFSHGSVALAMMATVAIPGLLPPVSHEGHIFVDGGLVSRLPVDLLCRRRCGLKIAVNAIPFLGLDSEGAARRREELSRRMERVLGLRHVIGEAWQMLGWWHGAAEARAADILIEPTTEPRNGFDFAAIDEMIEAGNATTVQRLPAIKEAVSRMMRPGVP